MNLILIRHAESTANSEGRWQGRADFPLSDAGRLQANRLKSRLAREDYTPTHIYSSPLSRVLETAQIASSIWDNPIELWDELMEHDVGAFSGLTWAEIEERYPEEIRNFKANGNFDAIEGAETHDEILVRARTIVDRLISEHENDDRVLVFSHGGILTHVIYRLLGTDRLWTLRIRNTAIFEFSIDVEKWHEDGRTRTNFDLWSIIRFNDAHHLDGSEE
ncbi:MAG: histidine phosphatase family protein [Dehalococcoidia bacterium]|nr:histidine phosphatase family protein [Dehalococcoidia bacterium]